MNIFVKSALVVLGIIGASVACTNIEANASSLEEVMKGSHKLYADGNDICSSVSLSENQIVTAHHCIDQEDTQYSIRFEKQEWIDDKLITTSYTHHNLKIIRRIKEKDVAFLELMDDSVKLQPVDIADEFKPKIGTPMVAIGYPRTDELTLTEGVFTALSDLSDATGGGWKGPFYKTTIPITGGSSGGGVYSVKDGDYKLVGLASAGYRDVSFQSYFSNIDSLKRVTKGLLNKKNKSIEELEVNSLMKDGWSIDQR